MSAKSKDTTKTAHVMNLLRKNVGGPSAEESAAVQETVAEKTEALPPKHTSAQHPMIASLNEEAAVSLEIKNALERELNDIEASQEIGGTSIRREMPSDSDLTKPTIEPVQEETTVAVLEEAQEEETEEITEDSVSDEMPEDAENTESTIGHQVPETDFSCHGMEIYNVMQAMVEENAEKYMTMFNLCMCPRCKADVRALALNHLQPKYVVMRPGEYIPRITVYEQQFSVAVTAQILRACKVVAELPRHGEMQ